MLHLIATRRLGSLLVAIAAAILMSGTCDRVFFARLQEGTGPDRLAFELGSHPDYSGSAAVYSVTITGINLDSPGLGSALPVGRTFWELRADSGVRQVSLAHLVYGAVPFGMHSTHDPDSLRSGFIYACEFQCYGLSPTVYFEVGESPPGARFVRSLTQDQFLRRSGWKADGEPR